MGSSTGGSGPRPCQIILQQCLAITLRKAGSQNNTDPGEFWMYDSGYLLFQSFLSSNSKCWWNSGLVTACRQLRYMGYVQYGVLLVGGRDACALELVRAAYARGVLKAPDGHIIVGLGDIDDCIVTPCSQTQFTPLPEALCDVILELTSAGGDAGIEAVRKALSERFPHITAPGHEQVYDALTQLCAERKVYHTSRGYFIVTPEKRRNRSHSQGRSLSRHRTPHHHPYLIQQPSYEDEILAIDGDIYDDDILPSTSTICTTDTGSTRRMLLSQDELLVIAHGDMATVRDGHVTHQCVQTSLRDVICGGSPSDKVIYPRSAKRRSASFPAVPAGSPERHRRRSTSSGRGGSGTSTAARLWGSARRLRRSASTRSLARDKSATHVQQTAATMTSTDSSGAESNGSPKKASLLSRLFRRSTKRQHMGTFSAQFPPPEWFNSSAIHLHSIGTQTNTTDMQLTSQETYYNTYDNQSGVTEVEITPSNQSARSATLPRIRNRHRRHLSNESTVLSASYVESREHSPSHLSVASARRRSPYIDCNTNSLPRNKPTRIGTAISKTSIDQQNARIASKNSLESSNSRIGKSSFDQQQNSRTTSKNSLNSNRLTSKNGLSPKRSTESPTKLPDNDRATLKSESLSPSSRILSGKNIDSTKQNGKLHSRNSIENRSMREISDKRSRNSIENRSMRENRPSIEKHIPIIQTENSHSKKTKSSSDSATLESPKCVQNITAQLKNASIGSNSELQTSENGTGSGPSSLESQKTGFSGKSSGQNSLTSGPSSLESQRTVISNKPKTTEPKDPKSKKLETKLKTSPTSKSSAPSTIKTNIAKSNSFTLHVTTNQNGVSVSNFSGEPSSNTTTTATINGTNHCGSNTKIYVQNSPIRSVITFENGQSPDKSDYIIINNDTAPEKVDKVKSVSDDEDVIQYRSKKLERPLKNVNNKQQTTDSEILNNSNVDLNEFESSTMNNSRKLSLQLPSKDGLSYKNVFKNVPTTFGSPNSNPGSPVIHFRDFTKNSFSSNPPSPTKSFDSFGGSISNMFYEKKSAADLKLARHSLDHSIGYQNGFESSTNSINKIAHEKNILGSEPNLSHNKLLQDRDKTLTRENVDMYNFPSLSDLSFNFTSLAAQKILKGVSINSVDTLVELNMAANAEKQNNRDVQHTDFGMV